MDLYDEPTPDLEELQQDDVPAMSTVPVRVQEAITAWLLPNRRVRIASELASDTTWTRVVDDTKKRSYGVLVAFGQPVRIRSSSSGDGMMWPAEVPYEFRHTQALYVKCATPSEVAEIGITEEFWAD